MEPTCGTGLDSGTSLEELTSSLAEEEIERILEVSADGPIGMPEVADDSLAFNTQTKTLVNTTAWRKTFATFLEQLSAAA
jgi:hypothetical protein